MDSGNNTGSMGNSFNDISVPDVGNDCWDFVFACNE